MSWLFETLVARTVLVLLLGIAAVQGTSLWYYEATLNSEAVLANDQQLADRLIVIYRAAARVAPSEREAVLHELAGGAIEAHWGIQRRAATDPEVQISWNGLREILVASVPQWAGAGLVIGKDADSDASRPGIPI